MSSQPPRWIPPMGWGGTLVSFGAPAVVLYVTTHIAIPAVTQSLGLAPMVWFMAFGAFYVLAPLLVIALLRLRGEALEDVAVWRERLRFRRLSELTASDWRFILTTLAASVVAGVVLNGALHALGVNEIVPSFLANSGEQALSSRDLLLSWSLFAALSIFAQETLWRGVYLPRHAQALGERAWIANAAGWALFHLALGWAITLVLLPMLVAVPYTAQRRGSSSAGAVVHAGGWVLALALGLQQQL